MHSKPYILSTHTQITRLFEEKSRNFFYHKFRCESKCIRTYSIELFIQNGVISHFSEVFVLLTKKCFLFDLTTQPRSNGISNEQKSPTNVGLKSLLNGENSSKYGSNILSESFHSRWYEFFDTLMHTLTYRKHTRFVFFVSDTIYDAMRRDAMSITIWNKQTNKYPHSLHPPNQSIDTKPLKSNKPHLISI